MKLVRIIRTPFGKDKFDSKGYSEFYYRLALIVKNSEEPSHTVCVFPDGSIHTVENVNLMTTKKMLKNYSSFEILRLELGNYKTLLNYYAHKSLHLNNDPELVTLLRIEPEGEAVNEFFERDRNYSKQIKLYQDSIHEIERQIQDRTDEEALAKIEERYSSKSRADFFNSEFPELPSGIQLNLF